MTLRLLPLALLLACDKDEPQLCKQSVYYADADGDGFGDPAASESACDGAGGLVSNADDCDDSRADAYPGAAEVWYDGLDQDCLGGDDYDQDGDGFTRYAAPTGSADDCDDADPEVVPGGVLNDYAGAPIPSVVPPLADPQPFTSVVSPVFPVTDAGGETEHHATVALGGDGRYMVTWQRGSGSAIALGAILNLDGEIEVGPFPIATGGTGGKPDVESKGGAYWVTWQGTDIGNIYLRKFDLDGNPLTDQVVVYESAFAAEGPDLALWDDGTSAVVWNVDGDPNEDGRDLYRRYDPDLNPIDDSDVFIAYTGRSVADTVALPDGRFVVVGTDKSTPEPEQIARVYGQIIHEDGCMVELRADGAETDWPSRPAVDVSPSGTIAVSWRDKDPPDLGNGAYGRLLDAGGVALGPPMVFDETDGNRVVVVFADELAFFAWQATIDGVPASLLAAVDSITGETVVPTYVLNEPGVDAERPAIDLEVDPVTGDVTLVSIWEQVNPDGDTSVQVRITRFER